LKNINLVGEVELEDKKTRVRIKGESELPKLGGKIQRVWLDPANPSPFPPTIQAILNADLILVGPGSLYTSIIANLLVPDLVEAIRASKAYKFYVCNVATQKGETEGFSCEDHVRTIEEHIGIRLFDLVLANNRYNGVLPSGIDWVKVDEEDHRYGLYMTDLADEENPWRHSSSKVAKTVMDLYLERTGPLSNKDGDSPI
jgi:uncharacterized cofD-like protein